MLKNIKSSYFNSLIFSYIDEKQKLKLIKLNKCLQKNLNISITNYMYLSDKYIIYEENNKMKEYGRKFGELLYEGEYLNGKRNGKGKEFHFFGKLEFEGEYLNGKRHGKGREYNDFGRLIFEGEYLNDERNGKGKEYDLDKLVFEGEYLNDKRNGKGKEFYEEGKLKFEGEYINDKEWIGTRYDKNGNILYKLNNDINGKGKEYDQGKLRFEGEYLNGKRNGKGREYNNYGRLIFEGEYLNDKRNGKGKEYDNNGQLLFEGNYFEDYEWIGTRYDNKGNIKYKLDNNINGKGKKYALYEETYFFIELFKIFL